jgi:hypothetical protein
MKKLHNYLYLVAFTLLGFSASAQSYPVSLYNFSQFAGTYSAVTGGTVFGNSSSDDEDFVVATGAGTLGVTAPSTGTGIPIGFNFNFAGTVYDRFGINNNGYIFLGRSALTPAVNSNRGGSGPAFGPLEYTSSTASLVLQNMICGFGTDLIQQANNSLRARLLGTTPNQTLVVQFNNFDDYSGGSLTFQIRLYETTNIIDVVYGTFSNLYYGYSAQVGLRGTAATTDFNMRDVNYATSSTNWASSGIAPDIYSYCEYAYTTPPSNGLTYRWTPPPPCSGAPALNPIVASNTFVCPGVSSRSLSFTNSYTISGISYQWQAATSSSLGPFTSIPNGTMSSLMTPTTNVTTWYQAIVTCASGGTTTIPAVQLQVQGTTTNSVPYFEGFEGSTSGMNELPNCSWNRSSTVAIQTNTFGGAYNGDGLIRYSAGNCTSGSTSYFYSNGIQLQPGITYSSSIWYQASFTSLQNISLLYGLSQSTVGLNAITTVSNPVSVSNGVYVPLTGTFQVSSAGLYYMAVKITNGCFGNIEFDDLSVTIPCSIFPNAPNLSVTGLSTICQGQTAALLANGASTYSWASGPTTAAYNVSPNSTTTYSVTGTNTLAGCSASSTKQIVVNPLPIVNMLPNPNQSTICAGSSINFNATGGAFSYTWNTGNVGSFLSATPSVTTVYSVSGTGPFGCIGTASLNITVNPLPVINVLGNQTICPTGGNFNASGANSYQWSSNAFFLLGASVSPNPPQSTNVTVSGTGANGCVGTYTFALIVTQCLSIGSINGNETGNASVYPNPTNGEFTIELKNSLTKTIELMDITGKLVLSTTTYEDVTQLNMSDLSNGIYLLKIKSENSIEIIKVVKQ